ncbi:isoprenylcysteine carboxylmethyltransferase family protein [Novosphingobium sp.]|uniref:methyltransferase family protein n=1 Tax=Novosphingobium sp. TaxID=1874826 RepID=UPI002733EADB|nr:methyltransferase [Novosphingobium sp.]MDP3908286.1 methyltransferase [Novosphingobium sp.]
MRSATSATAQTGKQGWLKPAWLDRFEQVLIVSLWIFLVWRSVRADNVFAPLVLIAETTVMVFVLIRRPTDAISVRLGDWFLAVTATAAPLLIWPAATPVAGLVPPAIALITLGNCFQIWAKLSLRRSFGIAPANRGVKRSGAYRFVRHPMYAGYLLVHIGIMVLMPSVHNAVLYGIGWTAQVLRLLAEERLLSKDPAYLEYTGQVRWRLIPGIF